jgi:hypothetical protein
MSMSIKGTNYTGFIDYDRAALRKASVETRILWLEYGMKKVITDPLDQILPPEAPCHKPVNDGDRTFNLCGVTLVACAIEGLGHFLTGEDDLNGISFKRWIKYFMPDWNITVDGLHMVDWLWDSARNGLAHQLAFKDGGTETTNSSKFVRKSDGQIEMDPFLFYADFNEGVAKFFKHLKTEVALQTIFERRFMNTLLPKI